MEDFHDVKIASEPKEGGEEHKKRLLNDLSFDDAMGCLNEEFHSNTPNYGHIYQGSQRLSLFVTERQMFRSYSLTQKYCIQGNHVSNYIGQQMEGISHDCD
jgi:hypothetical protein